MDSRQSEWDALPKELNAIKDRLRVHDDYSIKQSLMKLHCFTPLSVRICSRVIDIGVDSE